MRLLSLPFACLAVSLFGTAGTAVAQLDPLLFLK